MNTKLIYCLYRVVQALSFPALLFYFLLRSARDRRYFGTWRERLGFLPRRYCERYPGAIWLHAVSVGEAIAAGELAWKLRDSLPDAPVYLSTSTLAGHNVAEKCGAVAGVFFAAVDYAFAVRRIMRTIQPSVVIVLETEIWPNLLREAARAGCGLLIANGRISDETASTYARFRWFFRAPLGLPDGLLVQSEIMRARFIKAGAPAERVEVVGNLKYDFEPREAPPESPVRKFLRPGAKLWIAASTTADFALAEEDAVIEAFRQLAGWQLILAPRKPERFGAVEKKLAGAGLRFVRRSQISGETQADVLLLDTVGELAGLFPLADVVFMGGTLAARGGHNILEPAASGKPIVVGPHLENFREIAADFHAHQALYEILDGTELARAVLRAAEDRAMGERARARARAHRGAAERTVSRIRELHARRWPCRQRTLPVRMFLWPLARIWEYGGAKKRARDLSRKRALPVPVISVGNITVGGTGKTPLVQWLAERLCTASKTGILTRGHGRHSPHGALVLEPGVRETVENTGDEPQLFLRSGAAYLGIGADRFATGTVLCERFGVELIILDDGFQHAKLARQLDIVAIDALDPFGGCELVPLGRLREPLSALARADMFVITRADYGRSLDALEFRLRELNATAPVFRSRIVPECWIENATGERVSPTAVPFVRPLAFCGLGNPESFWRTLRTLGIRTIENLAFGDHHAYTPQEVVWLRQSGADALLTTEKDAVNLCPDASELAAPAKIYYLKIAIEIEREAALLEAISSLLPSARPIR